jgi:hypothetical protein
MFEVVVIVVIALALLMGYLIGRRFGPERVETVYVWKEVPLVKEQQEPVAVQRAQNIVIGGPTKGFGVN